MDYFKAIIGKDLKTITRRPSVEQSLKRLEQVVQSKFPLRDLGTATEALGALTEENRANHIHVLGTTREGKSKFLELMLRHDIDHGYGATLLDPSDNGQTAYNIVRYCLKKGFTKVCLIDPHDASFVVSTINPLRWRGAAATDAVVANVMDSIRVLWGQTSFEATPRIENYLYAVLTALYATGNPHVADPTNPNQYLKPLNCGIPDAVCFSVKENALYAGRRLKILNFLHPANEARATLEEVFRPKGQQLFLSEFKSTIRRLSPFFKYLPTLMYGSSESPIDFRKLIAEKWLVLVNLDKSRLWGTAQQKLMGTIVVNEIVAAIADLTAHGWHGKHYLYIDEAGQYATRALSDIMAYKGKSELWATLSHQYYDQFEDKQVLSAVENLCKIKVLFNTPNVIDRNRMIRDMYTGELKHQAVDVHAALKKQHAVIKIGKEPPATVRIADIPDVKVDGEELGAFKEKYIYQANPWYRTQSVIQEEINKRFAVQPPPTGAPPKERRPAGSPIKPQRTTGEPSAQPSQGADKTKPQRKSVFDDFPDS